MLTRFTSDYNFIADPRTGITMRWGTTLNDDPIWAPVPELADISISNHCTKGCSFCYRDSTANHEFMSVDDYCFVLDAMYHKDLGGVFQVALGGGEPLEHPDFLRIIDETIKRNIVPNFTTNGLHLSQDICAAIRGKVGAVALSISSINELMRDHIDMLVGNGIRTNIHYVLSQENIDEAIEILSGRYTVLFQGINAIIFLTYKPAGRADKSFILQKSNTFLHFLKLINDDKLHHPKVGFDACFVPMLMHYTDIRKDLIDTCEGGFFSVYIDHKMNVSPCSFSGNRDCYSLRDYSFYDIWENIFDDFRNRHLNKCSSNCAERKNCRGCCPYYPEITVCYE